jgi:alpha-tubulin suppressor-like RCC1 family protein
MSSNQRVTTNFIRSNGVDVAYEFITKDYLMSVYPSIAQQIGKTPELWTWGDGANGRLGNGVITGNISTPVTTFAGGTNWKQVSSGGYHTAAIKTDGTLWTWGAGSNGRLGNAQGSNRSTPVTTFAGGTNWKQVSAGYAHTAAIKTDGTLWTWGYGYFGQLGTYLFPTNPIRVTPVTTFAGGTNWKQVSCGGYFTAAIKTDGTLWTWGYGYFGQLGNAQTTNRSTPVTTFAGGTNWKQVSCSNNSQGHHTAAIKTDGTLWTWGNSAYGRLGNATDEFSSILTPVTTFAGGTNWKQVSCNQHHTAAIKTDGTLWAWGNGQDGRLGNGLVSFLDRISTPVTTFAGGTNWKQVRCGGQQTAAIKTDGTLWIWGTGLDGRLGNAVTTGNISTPVTTFAGGNNWKQVSSGGYHTAAIQSADFI